MRELTINPNTATVEEFEAALAQVRAEFYEPLAKRLAKRVAELEAQVTELRRLHTEADLRAADADARAKALVQHRGRKAQMAKKK